MAYVDEFNLINDTTNDLHKKVARAIDKASRDVLNEDPQTANHTARAGWAARVRREPEKLLTTAHRWMMHVLDNPTVAAAGNTATDSDVQFVVNGLIESCLDL